VQSQLDHTLAEKEDMKSRLLESGREFDKIRGKYEEINEAYQHLKDELALSEERCIESLHEQGKA
jgi:hypothetical protein